MRAILGWVAALAAGALVGVAVYHTVLADTTPRLAAEVVVPSAEITPEAVPTVYRTEVRTVVDPTPTVTVQDVVEVAGSAAAPGASRQAAGTPEPAPTSSTMAGSGAARGSGEREHADGESHDGGGDDHGESEHEDHGGGDD
jgi:hypothetical protein